MGGEKSNNDYIDKHHRREYINNRLEFDLERAISFLKTENPKELYNLLKLNKKDLMAIKNPLYRSFFISKKKGGKRKIEAPFLNLRIVQWKLLEFLNSTYNKVYNDDLINSFGFIPSKRQFTGFINTKHIVKNASLHVNKELVINVDIRDFFNSINESMLIELFESPPFSFNVELIDFLLQIILIDGHLPIGAPTSPILSNMVMRGIDEKLSKIKNYIYSRYADDITFSTNHYNKHEGSQFIFEIKTILSQFGFDLNDKKTKIMGRSERQLVTGLVVNEKVNVRREYIRNIRSSLHNINKNTTLKECLSIEGKIDFIGYVRGLNDSIYRKLKNELHENMVQIHPKKRFFVSINYLKKIIDPLFMHTSMMSVKSVLHRKWARKGVELRNIDMEQLIIDFYNEEHYIVEVFKDMICSNSASLDEFLVKSRRFTRKVPSHSSFYKSNLPRRVKSERFECINEMNLDTPYLISLEFLEKLGIDPNI